ncbi:MAG: L-histidine N(alpha)-methyltransferase [Acidimicrobiales bacterium]|nr:L-histidine N(alpha)-methyltransferase [Acidimicrobiales bacterium]
MIGDIERHIEPGAYLEDLRHDVLSGLSRRPKQLPPKWFYDKRGSELFDRITTLEEYYPTRAERSILDAVAEELAAVTRPETLVDLGSGSATKSAALLEALVATGALRTYVPMDVSEAAITSVGEDVQRTYPDLQVHGLLADFERHLDRLPADGRRLVAFLGSTIGNFPPVARSRMLSALRRVMGPGDALLLGTDLVKSPARLLPAYDDRQGVTAEFNRNVLMVVNRHLGADFDPDAFAHVAAWDADQEWIEMRLRSLRRQVVSIPDLGIRVEFLDQEEMRTEVSAKFRRDRLERELQAAGLELTRWWTDPAGEFALSLSRPSSLDGTRRAT